MSTSSTLTTTQQERSLFSEDPEGAVQVLPAACSEGEGPDLGLD